LLEDRLNQASLIDAGLASGARFARYAHGDVDALRRRLERPRDARLVASDGVFSMDGDVARCQRSRPRAVTRARC
jgi:8-amino-7-oxononanoate synthase